MKKSLIVLICFVMLIAPMSSSVWAMPSCAHTNSQGQTSVNLGNCFLNVAIAIVKFGINLRKYVCGASGEIIAICELVKPIAASVGAAYIVNVCESIITTGCSDSLSLANLVTFIRTYNAGQAQVVRTMKSAVAAPIPVEPIIIWGGKK